MAVATRNPNMAIGEALSAAQIMEQVRLVQDVMKAAMTEGEHYGKIPGCGDKKTLLQPGAQKLTLTFRLAPFYDIAETDLGKGHKSFRVTCTLKSILDGSIVGQGVGYCSTRESKYRWRKGEPIPTGRPVPKEYWNNRNPEVLGGKGFVPKKIENQWIICQDSGEKVENDCPEDCYNTCLKMAKKRAFVDATITATAASDIFTQDVGDNEDEPEKEVVVPPPSIHQPLFKPIPSPNTSAPPSRPAASDVTASEKTRTRTLELLKAGQGGENRAMVHEYLLKADILLPNEEPEDWPLRWVPNSREQLQALQNCIDDFAAGGELTLPYKPNDDMSGGKKSVPKQSATDGASESSPAQKTLDPSDPNSPEASWRKFQVPFGKSKGVELAALEKNTLFGFWANFKVETEWKGNPIKAEKIAADQAFRDALDAAGLHYEFQKKD